MKTWCAASTAFVNLIYNIPKNPFFLRLSQTFYSTMIRIKMLASFLCLLVAFTSRSQVITISAARSAAAGTQVTVRGIVTHGSEFGVAIRYFQDGTGGLAAYSAALMQSVNLGDSIEVTGTTKLYNNLLELDPVASVTVISNGNPLPAAIELSSAAAFNEAYEGMLVKVKGVTVTGTGTFSAGTSGNNYKLDNNTATAIRILPGTDIAGKQIPSSICDITGVMSQFSASVPTTGYQLLPRAYADFDLDNGPKITSILSQKNITPYSFDVLFNTKFAGSTVLRYGITPALELGSASDTTKVLNHSLKITGLQPATIYYVKGVTLLPSGDSSVTQPVVMATASLSSGMIKVLFTRDVRTTEATFTNAVFANQGIDDSVIAYINRAKYSIDIAMYNWNNNALSDITTAVNDAYNRGVKVRVVYDGSTASLGVNTLHASIGKIASPQGSSYTIMHNKFVIIDAGSTNPNDAYVLTGSTNWTGAQINLDANNQVIVQDQTLAKAYTLEFEEMFGSTGLTPNAANARFGQFKTNNTPHQFVIGGKQVEQYFSPSDNVTQQIISSIKSADNDLFFQILTFTRRDVAQAIAGRVTAGAVASGMVDDTANGSAGFMDMKAVMGAKLLKYSGAGLLHHKLVVVDANNYYSDPQVVTGSHNWSTSADTKNDENTLVIHDADLANQYFQEYTQQAKVNGIPWGWGFANFKADSLLIKQNHSVKFKNLSVFYDAVPAATTTTWDFGDGSNSSQSDPVHIYSQPGKYTVRLIAGNGTVTDTIIQNQLITVEAASGIHHTTSMQGMQLYPNPVHTLARIQLPLPGTQVLHVYNTLGQCLLSTSVTTGAELDCSNWAPGIYILSTESGYSYKLVKE